MFNVHPYSKTFIGTGCLHLWEVVASLIASGYELRLLPSYQKIRR